ncbi:MAG: TonB-dependent receptor [Nitrospiraceae bacterium]|nr:MAG: TonB-dependent receptor [Nitrospiraceae bacterium]
MSGVMAFAEDTGKSEPVQNLDPVVVIATKTPAPLSQTTSAVEVITEEDLQRQKFKTVADALRLSQGLAVFGSGGPGTEVTVRMRGGSPSQTLVLIDGAIVNSPTLGYYSFANLSTDNIERIEILRGPQSMLWGSDAMGGVINIITKRGTDTPRAGGFFEYGSFSSIREGAYASGQKGPLDLSASLTRWDTTGFSAADYRLGASERDGYRNWQGSSRAGLALPHDGRLDLTFRWLNNSANLDSLSNPPKDVFGSKTREQEVMYAVSHDQPLTTWWSHKLTLAHQEDRALFQPGTRQRNLVTGAFTVPSGVPNETKTRSNRIEVQENFRLANPLLLSTGYQFREQVGGNNTGLTSRLLDSHAGFAEAQLNAWDRVFATAGVRQDSYSVFGDATTYRVTGGYLVTETDTKIRGSYATGFRAPTINQLFFPDFGNPNLGPEKSRGFDVGVDQRFLGDRVRLSGGYFWNRFQNLILNSLNDSACAPFSTSLSCPRNIGAAVSKGWEASAGVTLLRDRPFARTLELQGQYTNTLTRDVSTSRRLSRWPVDQWSAVLNYQPIESLVTTLAARYVGSRFNDLQNLQSLRAFDVWSLSATYDVTKWVQAYTRVENLFDEKYGEILNAGSAVRSIYVGVKIHYDEK